jgi:hypothetical protein
VKTAYLLFVSLLVTSGCSKRTEVSAAEASRRRPTLVRSEPFPQVARSALKRTMIEHGDNMETLLWASLMLDYDLISSVSGFIVDRPKLSRPDGDRSTLNAYLPARFFELQERLYGAARDLAQAAEAKDDDAIARHYARIAETCVSCHSLYLRSGTREGK